jgi:glycosyltransferase involved in cell wall biosynthesis
MNVPTASREFAVSVIVPCRNEAACIETFLDCALRQEQPEGGLEILIADGMSDDGTRQLLARYAARHPTVRIIENPQRFVSHGLNAAIQAARGEVIVRMDVHTEYAPDYVRQCVRLLHETGADNVGGPARTRSQGYVQTAVSLAYHSAFSCGGASFHDPTYEGFVDTVTYGCWKKSTLLKIGLFDEELVRNQDDELNLRLVRAGGKIWQSPAICSWYYPRASVGALFRQYAQYGYWKVRVVRKHRVPASPRQLVPGAFVGALVILAVLAPFAPAYRALWLALVAMYALGNGLATVLTCRRPATWRYLPVMPLIFGAYHFGYGYGFLRGVMDFVLLKKSASTDFAQLTRGKLAR